MNADEARDIALEAARVRHEPDRGMMAPRPAAPRWSLASGLLLPLGLTVLLVLHGAGAQGQDPATADVFQFQIRGTAPPGQFGEPIGVAVDRAGRLYVVDRVDHQVRVLAPDGTLLDAWGGFGTADGRLAWPRDLAIGPDGSVYVLDSGNHRVQRFTAEGRHLSSWGGMGQQAGRFGRYNDYYSIRGGPRELEVGPDGSVYVADNGNERIQRFDAEGDFLGEWFVLPEDRGDDSVLIESITASGDGSIYVLADRYMGPTQSARPFVERFGPDGERLGTWAQELPELDAMRRLLARPDGNVLALSPTDLELRSPRGSLLERWRLPRDAAFAFSSGSALALDADGHLWAADGYRRRLLQLSPQAEPLAVIGGGEPGPGQIDYPWSVAIGPRGEIYVADVWNHQVQRFDARGQFLGRWGRQGDLPGELDHPVDLAVSSDGTVYVADSDNRRVQVFDEAGRYRSEWRYETPEGRWRPDGIAILRDRFVLVSNRSGDFHIEAFLESGQHAARWSTREWLTDFGVIPSGMPHADQIYVLGFLCWGRYDLGGERQIEWIASPYRFEDEDCDDDRAARRSGARGRHEPHGPASIPIGLYAGAPAADGTVYVSTGGEIFHYTGDGRLIRRWGGNGSDPGGFLMPASLAVMPAGLGTDPLAPPGTLYVADAENRRVQVFGFDRPEWRVGYYDNPWLVGYPRRIDEQAALDLDWGLEAPHPELPAEGFSVVAERRLSLDETARLGLAAEGGLRLWVDDRLRVDAIDAARVDRPDLLVLGPGEHALRIHFRDTGGRASLRLEQAAAPPLPATPTPDPTATAGPDRRLHLPIGYRRGIGRQ